MRLSKVGFFVVALLLLGCGDRVSEDKFLGTWELKGRDMFEGIQIKIEKNDSNFKGKIVKLNNHKLVKMFAEINDTWVSEIQRSSNFEFRITEKKLARELFSLYGSATSQTFKVQFINDNTIGLGLEGDPKNSTIIYKRVVE